MKYSKPHLCIPQQIQRLQARGLIITDKAKAEFCLQHYNYYRLRGYWYPFEQDTTTHQFRPNVTFDDVFDLYRFDRKLRLVLLEAIARVEVSVRSQWAYRFSAEPFGAFGYLDPKNNRRHGWLQNNKQSLKREVSRSSERFITHFRQKYSAEPYPPIWMSAELISFGLFSRWLKNLKPTSVAKQIAKPYGVDKSMLPGVVEHLVYVRNLCAHHSRVWNRDLTIPMPLPRTKPPQLRQSMHPARRRKLYNTLVMLVHLDRVIEPTSDWAARLVGLIDVYQPDTGAMGFPADWRERLIWQGAA